MILRHWSYTTGKRRVQIWQMLLMWQTVEVIQQMEWQQAKTAVDTVRIICTGIRLRHLKEICWIIFWSLNCRILRQKLHSWVNIHFRIHYPEELHTTKMWKLHFMTMPWMQMQIIRKMQRYCGIWIQGIIHSIMWMWPLRTRIREYRMQMVPHGWR